MNRSLRSNRDDRGVVALEFVLALPFLLMLVIGAVVLGNFLRVKTQTTGLARDGARAAALRLALPTGTSVVGAACPSPTDPTKFVTVQASTALSLRSIPPLLPNILPANITETVTMRCGG
ncbi:MAG TPA: TadE family protein [Ilumatobacteraceae bacterium]|nr:TadE family protein [Ilumatobacteraceae bacterium]